MPEGVTLAIMVRDDAERLDRCITSLEAVVDEIVVLDTGSKDQSVEIAKKHGAVTYEIEWRDDFSYALNILVSKVKTDWTIRLDSDEWFDPDQAKALCDLTRHERLAGYYLVRRDIIDATGKFDEIHVLRAWRTHEKIIYEGAVHEVIRHSRIEQAWPGKVLLTSGVYFWHDGYVHQAIEKGFRNLEILRKEVNAHPEKIEAKAMLATTLCGLKEPEGRLILQEVVDYVLDPSFAGMPPTQLILALAMFMETIPTEDVCQRWVDRLLQKSVQWFPKSPHMLFYAGVLERRRENFEASCKYFSRLADLVDSGDFDRGIAVPPEFVGERLWKSLGFVATKLGRQDIVRKCQMRLAARA